MGILEDRRLPTALVGVAMAVAVAILLSWDSHLTFIADDWMLLVKRHGWGAGYFLKPFHGNIVLAPALVYRLLRETVGMGSATPFYVVSIGTFVLSAWLLYFYLRRRVGAWAAAVAAILLLFLGAAFEDLLWAFQIGYFGSVAAGLGMLIALDRSDDRGDAIASALLVCSLAFSSVGLAFAAGALLDLIMSRRPWRRRAYVALAPIGLYVLWWVGWGHSDESNVSAHNILSAPAYMFRAASAGFTSLIGLASNDGSEPEQPHLIWGSILVCAWAVLVGIRIAKERTVSRGLAVALAIGLAFWLSAALNYDVTRAATSSRYQYPSAVFVLLIVAESIRGIRLPRWLVAPAAVGVALAIAGGLTLMHREYRERWIPSADSLRTRLGAIEIAEAATSPTFLVEYPPDITTPAVAYLRVAEQHGSPAFTESQLAGRPQGEREYADVTLAQALGLAIEAPAPGSRITGCQTLKASESGLTGLTLLHGGFTFTSLSGEAELHLGRFADGYPAGFGPLPLGKPVQLTIPTDGSPRPWRLGLIGRGRVRLCTQQAAD